MDPLSSLLDDVKVRGSVFCHGTVKAPWCMSGGAEGICLFHIVLDGVVVANHGGRTYDLEAGDIILLPRGELHLVGSSLEVSPRPLRDSVVPTDGFARLVSDGDGAAATLICGTFQVPELERHPLLRQLPEALVVNAADSRWLGQTLISLDDHVQSGTLGADVVVKKLLEILFVQAVAAWLEGDLPEASVRAFADPNIGSALAAIHARPGEAWSVDLLAKEAAMSRSSFYRAFSELVGMSPGAYVREWRMTLAARWLSEGVQTVSEISAELGYSSPPAFSRAFKEHYDVAPSFF